MKIESIKIKNFKSIKDIEINCNEGINAFIGKNGTGKSAVFEAVNFVLGNRSPYDRVSSQLILREMGGQNPCKAITCDERIFYFNTTIESNVVKVEPRMINTNSTFISFNNSQNLPKIEIEIAFKDSNILKCELSTDKDDPEITFKPFYYRNHPFELNGISRGVDHEISLPKVKVHLTINENGNERILTEKERQKYKIFYFSADRLTDSFGKNEIQPPNRSGQLIFSDDRAFLASAGEKVNYLHFKIVSNYGYKSTDILFIDEPELYLHPHAKKALYRTLQELTEKGMQIFYITHSSEFLSYHKSQEIFRFYIDDENGTKCKKGKNEVGVEDNIDINNNKISYNAAFFADIVFIVEGHSDFLFLNEVVKFKTGKSIDFLNISIIEAVGKTNINNLYETYELLEIGVFALYDKDIGKAIKNPNKYKDNNLNNSRLQALKNRYGFEEDLETFLDLTTGGKQKKNEDKVRIMQNWIQSSKSDLSKQSKISDFWEILTGQMPELNSLTSLSVNSNY